MDRYNFTYAEQPFSVEPDWHLYTTNMLHDFARHTKRILAEHGLDDQSVSRNVVQYISGLAKQVKMTPLISSLGQRESELLALTVSTLLRCDDVPAQQHPQDTTDRIYFALYKATRLSHNYVDGLNRATTPKGLFTNASKTRGIKECINIASEALRGDCSFFGNMETLLASEELARQSVTTCLRNMRAEASIEERQKPLYEAGVNVICDFINGFRKNLLCPLPEVPPSYASLGFYMASEGLFLEPPQTLHSEGKGEMFHQRELFVMLSSLKESLSNGILTPQIAESYNLRHGINADQDLSTEDRAHLDSVRPTLAQKIETCKDHLLKCMGVNTANALQADLTRPSSLPQKRFS